MSLHSLDGFFNKAPESVAQAREEFQKDWCRQPLIISLTNCQILSFRYWKTLLMSFRLRCRKIWKEQQNSALNSNMDPAA